MPNDQPEQLDADQQKQIFALEAKIASIRGEKLTTEQSQAAREYDQNLIDHWLHNCKRTHYGDITGRSLKTLQDNRNVYGLPVGAGDSVDIVDVLRWFHDYLAKWGPKIQKHQLIDEESAKNEAEKDKLEMRRMAATIAKIELDVERRKAETISIQEVKKALAWLAGELRKLGERLGKKFGPDAQIAMNESLVRIEATLADEMVAK